MTRKLRLRLSLIAALPEPILLERLCRLSVGELIAFRRRYGIRECYMKGRCRIHQFGELRSARIQIAVGRSCRLARQQLRELRDNPTSMYQTRCRCSAAGQAIPRIPFTAHQLLADLLKAPEGERGPNQPRRRPNRRHKPGLQAA